jgi:cytoskeletal protein RodZ
MNTNQESFSSSGSSPYAAPGAQLRQAREHRGLSLDEVATKTRVQRRYLQALEEGTVDKLPEPVYARGFLKRYADFLNLDSAGIAERYFPMADIRKQGNSGPLLMPPSPKQTNWLGYTAGVVVAVLGLSTFFALKTNAPSTSATAQASGKSEPSPLEKMVKGAGAPTQSSKSAPTNTVTPASNQVVASKSATQPAGTQQPILTPPSVTPVPTAQLPVQVAVKVAADTWVRVSADGRTVFQGVLPKGAQRNWSAKQSVKFRTGNAGGILVSHNQKAIGALGAPGKVVERVFTKNPATPN